MEQVEDNINKKELKGMKSPRGIWEAWERRGKWNEWLRIVEER